MGVEGGPLVESEPFERRFEGRFIRGESHGDLVHSSHVDNDIACDLLGVSVSGQLQCIMGQQMARRVERRNIHIDHAHHFRPL